MIKKLKISEFQYTDKYEVSSSHAMFVLKQDSRQSID